MDNNSNSIAHSEPIPVSDFMTVTVITATENQNVRDVCKLMYDKKIMSIVILENTKASDTNNKVKCRSVCRHSKFQIYSLDNLILQLSVLLSAYKIYSHIHLILSAGLLSFHLDLGMVLSLVGE